MKNKQTNAVENLLKKATDTNNASEAMNYTQAACNAAKAIQILADIQVIEYT